MSVNDKTELFSLYWYDPDGRQYAELKHVPCDEKFVSALKRLTQGPAAQIGAVTKVVVTDQMDFTNFLWEKGVVIFPTKEDVADAEGQGV